MTAYLIVGTIRSERDRNFSHEIKVPIHKQCSKYRGSPDSTNFAPPGNRTIEKIVLSGVWFSTKMLFYAFWTFKVHFFAHFHKFQSSLQNKFSKKTMTWSLSDNFNVQSLSTVDNFLNFGPDIVGFWIYSAESWQYLKQLYWKNCQVSFFWAKKILKSYYTGVL